MFAIMNKTLLSILLMFMVFTCGCEKEQVQKKTAIEYEVNTNSKSGPLVVNFRIESKNITIADTLKIELEVIADGNWDIDMPGEADMLELTEDFDIIDSDIPPAKLLDGDRRLYLCSFRLEPVNIGECAIQSFEIVYSKKETDMGFGTNSDDAIGLIVDDEAETYLTDSFIITVTDIISDAESDQEISDIRDVQQLAVKRSYWWAYLIGGVLILAIIILVIRLMAKNKEQKRVRIMKAAHEVAYQALESLQRQKLIESGQTKQYYQQLNLILRRYIEDRFQLRAPEMTSHEFLDSMNASSAIGFEHRQMLSDFLSHCDLVKYACYNPASDEIAKAIDITKGFIASTRIFEKLVDVTDRVSSTTDGGKQ